MIRIIKVILSVTTEPSVTIACEHSLNPWMFMAPCSFKNKVFTSSSADLNTVPEGYVSRQVLEDQVFSVKGTNCEQLVVLMSSPMKAMPCEGEIECGGRGPTRRYTDQ
jgi:hypothetical protein